MGFLVSNLLLDSKLELSRFMVNSKASISASQSNNQASEESADTVNFSSILNTFQYRITCLATGLNMIQFSEEQTIVAHSTHIYQWAKSNNCITSEEVNEDNIKFTFLTTERDRDKIINHQLSIDFASHASYIMRRNLIVSLVSEIDLLIAELIKLGFSLYPNMLDSSEKNFSLSDLSKFTTIDDAKDYWLSC